MKRRQIAPSSPSASRRDFLQRTGRVVAASALAGVAIPWVHAGEDSTIRLALVGCGGRGSGAAANALSVPGIPARLVAMADVFEDRLANSYKNLSQEFRDRVDVPPERRFVGFDAYRKAIDCLRGGDVVLLTTHAAFRATHFAYAVEKGVHVFMEKTFAPDPGGVKDVIRIGELAEKKNLKVACGLMCRHSTARQEMIRRIRDGAMGQIQLIRAYRMDPGARMAPYQGQQSELLWQIRRPYFFYWASSGLFIELMIHQIDECCWIKDAWPVSAHGLGGRAADSRDASQNLDTYAIEFTFADGSKALVNGRNVPNCFNDFSTYVHGTKCAGQFSGNIHAPTVQMYKDQRIAPEHIVWKPPAEKVNPWQAEWNVLLEAIVKDRPHNEARRSALSNLAAIMGRAAVHTGQVVTWEQAMGSNFRFCPNVPALDYQSPAPVRADAEGRYPVPVPGHWTEL